MEFVEELQNKDDFLLSLFNCEMQHIVKTIFFSLPLTSLIAFKQVSSGIRLFRYDAYWHFHLSLFPKMTYNDISDPSFLVTLLVQRYIQRRHKIIDLFPNALTSCMDNPFSYPWLGLTVTDKNCIISVAYFHFKKTEL